MAIAAKSHFLDDRAFYALCSKFDDGQELEYADDWENARDTLDSIISSLHDAIDAAEEALQYAEGKVGESKAADKVIQEAVGVGWECSGCGTGTFSRCLACDEAACGLCLISHECSLVEVEA